MIDIALITYDTELITENGMTYSLNDALVSLMWEEQENTLAQRATLGIANMGIGTSVMGLAKINCVIRIFGNWSSVRTLLFEGYIWDWQYVNTGSQKVLTIIAYDTLIRLQQSKDFKYFSPGMSTQTIISNICADWNIPFEYKWRQSLTHEKKVFSSIAISDMIIRILNEVKRQTGEKYVVLFRDGKMEITGYGNNKDIYKFTDNNSISTNYKLEIYDLITEVWIYGKQDDEERRPVDDKVFGDKRFGNLREIILRDGSKTLEAVRAEAEATLKERGQPDETITAIVPDLPFLRRGDAVNMAVGNLLGIFYVLGVSHNATQKQMTLSLMRS